MHPFAHGDKGIEFNEGGTPRFTTKPSSASTHQAKTPAPRFNSYLRKIEVSSRHLIIDHMAYPWKLFLHRFHEFPTTEVLQRITDP